MTKLNWGKARRNPNGYVSIDHGAEEIVGVDRWGARPDAKQSSKTSPNHRRTTKHKDTAKAVSAKGAKTVSERAWPDIPDHTKAALAGKTKNQLADVRAAKDRMPTSPHGSGKSANGTVTAASTKKHLRREVLSYLIRMGPGRTEDELAKAIYGDVGRRQQVSKDCDILVREGWADRKAQGSDRTLYRYFAKA